MFECKTCFMNKHSNAETSISNLVIIMHYATFQRQDVTYIAAHGTLLAGA